MADDQIMALTFTVSAFLLLFAAAGIEWIGEKIGRPVSLGCTVLPMVLGLALTGWIWSLPR